MGFRLGREQGPSTSEARSSRQMPRWNSDPPPTSSSARVRPGGREIRGGPKAAFSRATRDKNIHNFREDIWETTDLAGYQFNPHVSRRLPLHLLSLNSDQPGITPNPSGRDIVPSLSLGVRIDTRDHSLRPGLRQWAPARLRHWRTGRGLAGSCSLTGRVRFRRRDGL